MLRKAATALRRILAPLLGDTRGVVAVVFALALVPMIGAAGLAIDSSLAFLLKSRMTKALDTAGLAAGRVALTASAPQVARQYFDANFASANPSVTVTSFRFELDATRQFVTVSATATAPTYFMRIFGRNDLDVAARTVIERQTTGMEIALVMDNTGSMHGTPFNTMQQAALDLVDIIYGDETQIENLYISLVPYAATVNIGATRTNWLAPTDRARVSPQDFMAPGWLGCVMAGATPLDLGDAPPTVQPLTSFFYASTARTQDNNWGPPRVPPFSTAITARNNGYGPNLGCVPAITPLTASRTTVDNAILGMGAWHRGGTATSLGLVWGWRTLSPRWRGLWGGETPNALPLDYGTPLMEKVVVILTDGANTFHDQDTAAGTPLSDFTSYGRLNDLGVTSQAAGRALIDTRMRTICTSMKAEGIKIYSIIFGASPDATAQTLFRNCATTTAMYYYAPTNATLAEVFRAIGGELATLRIVN